MVGGLRIKLARWGFRNRPFYVLSVMEKRQARNSGVRKEDIGWWDPSKAADGNMHLGLNFERLKYWLTAGAKPTEKVAELLGYVGVLPPVPKPPAYKERDPKDDTKWRPEKLNK